MQRTITNPKVLNTKTLPNKAVEDDADTRVFFGLRDLSRRAAEQPSRQFPCLILAFPSAGHR